MDIKTLKTFCDPIRETFRDVIVIDNRTIATDGYVLVCLDNNIGGREVSHLPIAEDIRNELSRHNQLSESDYVAVQADLSIMEKNKQSCSWCDGTGKTKKCDNCDDGTVLIEDSAGNTYDCECKECDGTGKAKKGQEVDCEKCSGTGYVVSQKERAQPIGDHAVDVLLLQKINQLPNCKIAYNAAAYHKPIPFVFDGGIGLIMGMRKIQDINYDC